MRPLRRGPFDWQLLSNIVVIPDNGVKIKFESMDRVDFKQIQIIIKDANDIIFERRINLATIDPADRELIMERLTKKDASAANKNA